MVSQIFPNKTNPSFSIATQSPPSGQETSWGATSRSVLLGGAWSAESVLLVSNPQYFDIWVWINTY